MSLSQETIDSVLSALPHKAIGVLGDLFLDRYLDIDAALTEPSIETGLDAYQVVSVRSYPGAAGTVMNNLAALGVGRIHPIAVIGDDGEGYELRAALKRLPGVRRRGGFFLPHPADADLHQADAAQPGQPGSRAESARHQEPLAHAGRV